MRAMPVFSILSAVAVAACLALSAPPAAAAGPACPVGPYQVKSITKTYRDAARANRSVGVRIFYPTVSSTSSAIVTGCSLPVISFGCGSSGTDVDGSNFDHLTKVRWGRRGGTTAGTTPSAYWA